MNLTSIVFAGLAGALAGMLARVIANPKENKNAYVGAFVILFAGLYYASKTYAVPWWDLRTAEREISEVPAFKALKEHDPETYRNFMADVEGAIRNRKGTDEAIKSMRARVIDLVQERLPIASNEAAMEYIAATMTELDELYERGDDTCHQFMFPADGVVPLDIQKYVSKEAQQNDLRALAMVIESSSRNPQDVPEEREVMPHLQPVFERLASTYGGDIALIQNPGAPGADKRKLCAIVSDLYSQVLQMPAEEGGKVLRFMISQGT
jgi:hypothetical protein